MEAYCIFDTVTQTYWKSPKGKSTWSAPGRAKNAWNCQQHWSSPKFSEQNRFVCHRMKMYVEEEV